MPKKEIQYRKKQSINIDELKKDIVKSGLLAMQGTVDELVDTYNTVLSETLERHAPLKTCHYHSPRGKKMNDEIKQPKHKGEKQNAHGERQDFLSTNKYMLI